MSTASRDSTPPAKRARAKARPAASAASRLLASTRILAGSRVFAELPAEELERLASRSTLKRLRADEALTRHGDRVNWLIVVGEGRLKVVLPTPEAGGDFLAGTFVAGDVIGEIGVFENMPRVGSHSAIEPTEVVLIPKAELLALIDRQPRVAVRLLEVLSTKLRLAMDLGLALHSMALPARFYRRLLYFSRSDSQDDGNGLRIRHGLSQRELADSIGVTRESLNRLLAEWKQAGLIDYGRGFVLVLDAEELVKVLPEGTREGSLLKAAGAGDQESPAR